MCVRVGVAATLSVRPARVDLALCNLWRDHRNSTPRPNARSLDQISGRGHLMTATLIRTGSEGRLRHSARTAKVTVHDSAAMLDVFTEGLSNQSRDTSLSLWRKVGFALIDNVPEGTLAVSQG
jgi:hypothetical protein